MTKQRIKRIIDFIGFVAVLVTAVLVLVGKLVPQITTIMYYVSWAIAFLVAALCGGYYAISRRNGIFITLYVAAMLAIIVIFIIL